MARDLDAIAQGPVRAGVLVDALLGGSLGKKLDASGKAARAWYAANGDRERKHTVGVWLRKSGRAGIDPVLVVALDSGLLATELGTNKDLYLQRLAFRGIRISDIRFQVSRETSPRAQRAAVADKTKPKPELPDLGDAEQQRIERAVEDLPEGLKQSVSRAMCATMRRNKVSHT